MAPPPSDPIPMDVLPLAPPPEDDGRPTRWVDAVGHEVQPADGRRVWIHVGEPIPGCPVVRYLREQPCAGPGGETDDLHVCMTRRAWILQFEVDDGGAPT
ncbi:MAG: hypothetical protein ACLP8Y_03370 [Thermoplasmata archaeon]